MNILYTHLLTCPVCHVALAESDQTLKCANRHSFDMAREGYVNLLLKRLPGDSKAMLQARRDFLERDHYRPLSDTLNELVASHIHNTPSPVNILDAGCGEGYYLGRLHQYLTSRQLSIQSCCVGVDISKDAIRMAAKRYRETLFVVTNLKERLVFADDTFQALLNIFAPRNAQEYARVLAPGGLLVVVIPGPTHLLQLRSALHLLSIEQDKQQHIIEQFAPQFELITTIPLAYEIHLTGAEIALTVMMTPNYWHLTEETKRNMAEETEMRTQVEFSCLLLQKKLTGPTYNSVK
ncbi:MAG TPA: methyltransferase domain-containing protein [Ktedonosporobacter sp.]|jgi:23S rRNA (guanine745-N1)-methyltransferase|nr:methyltransferase domain-containing protein [Ktedonosporobacter sp.]